MDIPKIDPKEMRFREDAVVEAVIQGLRESMSEKEWWVWLLGMAKRQQEILNIHLEHTPYTDGLKFELSILDNGVRVPVGVALEDATRHAPDETLDAMMGGADGN